MGAVFKFAGCDLVDLRLQRALGRAEALSEVIEGYRDSGGLRSSWVWGARGRKRVEVVREPDPQWCIDVGEIVYLARTSLDQAAALMFANNTGRDPMDFEGSFPVAVGLSRGDARKALKEAADEATLAITLTLQPKSPTSALALLHKMSNQDKHRSAHLSIVAVDAPTVVYSDDDKYRNWHHGQKIWPDENLEFDLGGILDDLSRAGIEGDVLLGARPTVGFGPHAVTPAELVDMVVSATDAVEQLRQRLR